MKRVLIGAALLGMTGCTSAESDDYKPYPMAMRYSTATDIRNLIYRLEKIEAKLDRIEFALSQRH